MESVTFDQPTAIATSTPPENVALTNTTRDSVAIRRLMEEVRCEDVGYLTVGQSYDRSHNRHNR